MDKILHVFAAHNNSHKTWTFNGLLLKDTEASINMSLFIPYSLLLPAQHLIVAHSEKTLVI